MISERNTLKSPEGFEALFQNSSFGILAVKQNGLIELANSFIEKLLGYYPGELVGQPVEVLVPEALRDKHVHDRADYMQGHTVRPMGAGLDLNARHKDGTLFPVEINLSYYNLNENEIMVLVFIRDIGKRKRTEEQLRANEQLFRKFIEDTPAAVAMFDNQMRYIIVSKRWMTDYRLGERNIIGLCHYDVFPNLPDEFKEFHRRGLAGEEFRDREDPFVREDGSVQWVRWEITPWQAVNGEIGGIIFYSEVITERKIAEERLRQSEERFRLFFEGIKDAFIVQEAVKDKNGAIVDLRILDLNKPGEHLYGKPRAELIGNLRSNVFGKLDTEGLDISNRVLLKKELVIQERYLPVTKRWYETTSYSPVPDQIVSLSIDITDKKEKDEKLRRARVELQKRFNHLKRLNDELRDFAFVSSHHLQEPLRKLQTFVTLIQKTQTENLDTRGKEYLEKTLIEASIARERVENFLLFTNLNIQSRIRIPVNLNDILNGVLDVMSLEISETHSVIEVLNELPTIHADPGMMRTLFQHLIANAIKFRRLNVPPHIRIFTDGTNEDDQRIEIHFEDNGIGIQDKYIGQLFKLFKKVSAGSPGMGVGLAVSRKICNLHQGDLKVVKQTRRGFNVYCFT